MNYSILSKKNTTIPAPQSLKSFIAVDRLLKRLSDNSWTGYECSTPADDEQVSVSDI